MWKCFILLIVGVLLFAGCTTNEQIMLSKLKESVWYKSQIAQTSVKDSKGLRLATGYIFAGYVKEIRYNYYQKTISNIVLSPSYCLFAPSYWDEWFSPDPVEFSTKNDDFADGYFPTVGEYWAFGVNKVKNGRYDVESAVKLYMSTSSSSAEK